MISVLTQFSHINSRAENMVEQNASIVIYTKGYCPYCVKAKDLFDKKGLQYTEINIEKDQQLMQEVIRKSGGRRTFPQIFINDQHIGGCDDLYQLNQNGKLEKILNGE